jgi:hypothetical protein
MIAVFAICAVALAVCVWAYLEGRRRRRRHPAPVARVLVPHHPAWHRAHPRNPGLPVDGRPLDDYEARAFDAITERRVLVTAATMIVPSGAWEGSPSCQTGPPRPAADAWQPAGRQERCEGPGELGDSPWAFALPPTRTEEGGRQ